MKWINRLLAEARLKLPADTVISYWKPEVSVRLVSDFAVYPFDHGEWIKISINSCS